MRDERGDEIHEDARPETAFSPLPPQFIIDQVSISLMVNFW
jgi:hypothetical protein